MMPQKDEILLDEPEVIRHGNKYGVKMKAQAPSVNLIRAQIETEIAPIVGSEQQAKDLIAYIKSSSKDSEEGIWNANIFGKSIEQIVEDGIQAKISQMTDECQQKLQDTLQKIINDSNGDDLYYHMTHQGTKLKIRCKLACKRIFELGTRWHMRSKRHYQKTCLIYAK